MGSFHQDLRFALRMLARAPVLTATLVLTLALGVGANTAIFSLVDGLLLRPIAAAQPQRLVALDYHARDHPDRVQVFSNVDVQDLRAATGNVFTGVAAYTMGLDGLRAQGATQRVFTTYVTGDYFQVLGLQPAAGRLIQPGQGVTPGADPEIVLGYSFWQSHFGADRGVIGRKVDFDGQPVTIIGVAPRGFRGLNSLADAQVYVPLAMALTFEPADFPSNFLADRGQRAIFPFARLQPHAALPRAKAATMVLADRLGQDYPQLNRNLAIGVFPLQDYRVGQVSQMLETVAALFLMLAGLVLLLACVNVANLLLVRASARGREMAVRAALGAGRQRLMRQMLTESLLLSLLGGAAGLALGVGASRAVDGIHFGTSLPILLDFGLNWHVFLYTLAIALVTGALAGTMPAMRASGGRLNPMLHSGLRVTGHGGLRSTLVAAQVAGSLMLLVTAGLFVRSLSRAQHTDLGFEPRQVADASFDTHEIGMSETRSRAFDQALLQRVDALPGVDSAAIALATPLGYFNGEDTIMVPGYSAPPGQSQPPIVFNMVTTGYFRTLRIPLVAGRDFRDADIDTTQHVAIVNQALAAKYWPGQSALGRSFTMNSDKQHPLEVIGVAGNCVTTSLFSPAAPAFYVALPQNDDSYQTLLVRTPGPPATMLRPMAAAITSLEPDLQPFDVQTLESAMETLSGFMIIRLGAVLAGGLGALGLALALVGIYGVISYSTAQRTPEIGIRMALGAQSGAVLRLILRQGLIIVGAGVTVGLLLALLIGQRVAPFLLGVSGRDPRTLLTVTGGLAAAALLASFLPARRATRLNPASVLRTD